MTSQKLIFDIGMHHAQDTGYFLGLGHKVVAVDADPQLIENATAKFEREIAEGQLTLVQRAIAEKAGQEVAFNVGEKDLWSSLIPEVAGRGDHSVSAVQVKTETLSRLVEQFGRPHYIKIDIEGYDNVAVRSLQSQAELPQYISVESECVAEGQTLTEHEALETLMSLKELGYNRFKLVDQQSLAVLTPERKFYTNLRYFGIELVNKFQLPIGARNRASNRFEYRFPFGATGPFGDQLMGQWVDFSTAKVMLLKHREDYFKLWRARDYGFWVDWHAGL